MKKSLKIILIISAVGLTSFGFSQSIQAQDPGSSGLTVQVCKTENNPSDCVILDENNHASLFNESDILPGNFVNRWVKVINNSGDSQEIGIKVTGSSSACPFADNTLSDVLNLTIRQGLTELYNGSLTSFYSAGELYLSRAENAETNIYQFSVIFSPESGNNYQGCNTNFDFEIGFWGESISGEITPGGGGSGGGSFTAGLIISEESASQIENYSTIITWLTNRPATSRVIWASENEEHNFDWKKPPNYGYTHTTTEDSSKETSHSVFMSGLAPNTTYYYRCVSHASPDTVSVEHSFTTLALKKPEIGNKKLITNKSTGSSFKAGKAAGEAKNKQPESNGQSAAGSEGENNPQAAGFGLNKFLAAIGDLFNLKDPCFLIFFFAVMLTILFLLSLTKKHKEETKKKKRLVYQVFIPALIIISIILQYIFCPYWWILLLTIIILFALFFLFKINKKTF